MKKILLLSIALFGLVSAQAQHTVPRYSTSPTGNQTFGNLKLGYVKTTDLATEDTIQINPNAYKTHLALTVTDTVNIYASIGSAYVGDELIVSCSNTAGSGHVVRFTGRASVSTPFEVSSSGILMVLTASKRAIIRFMFDGVKWVEVGRMVQ